MTLELRNVTAAYGARRVLDAIDLRIADGERVALVGPNGAGKSTLLRCLTGLVRPVHGVVAWDGIPVAEIDRLSLARRVAVVPQEIVLPFSIRVEALVELGRVPHEHPLLGPRERDREAVERALDRVGIAALAGRDVRELSLGERQLALLAMALAQEAAFLVLDEPTVHLDLHHQVRIMELLRGLTGPDDGAGGAFRTEATVLAVLHEVRLAARFFPRLIVLDRGRVVADGAPEDVLTDALIERVFRVDPGFVKPLPV